MVGLTPRALVPVSVSRVAPLINYHKLGSIKLFSLVLESRSPKSEYRQDHTLFEVSSRDTLFASPSFWQCLAFLGLWPHLPSLPLSAHGLFPVSLHVSHLSNFYFAFTFILAIGFRAHKINPGRPHLEMLSLMISTKTLFPSKVAFLGSRAQDVICFGEAIT